MLCFLPYGFQDLGLGSCDCKMTYWLSHLPILIKSFVVFPVLRLCVCYVSPLSLSHISSPNTFNYVRWVNERYLCWSSSACHRDVCQPKGWIANWWCLGCLGDFPYGVTDLGGSAEHRTTLTPLWGVAFSAHHPLLFFYSYQLLTGKVIEVKTLPGVCISWDLLPIMNVGFKWLNLSLTKFWAH